MRKTQHGFRIDLPLDFESSLELAKSALERQGFGVVAEIDVTKMLKERLNVEFREYRILGVCDPLLTLKALAIEEEVGLLLPCKVAVYEVEDGVTRISVADPYETMGIFGNSNLDHITGEAGRRLRLSLLKLALTAVEITR